MDGIYRSSSGGGTIMAGTRGRSDNLVGSQMRNMQPGQFWGPQGGMTGMADRTIGVNITSHDEFLKNQMLTRKNQIWERRGERFAQSAVSTAKTAGKYGMAAGQAGYRVATGRAGKAAYGAFNKLSMKAFGASIPQIAAVSGAGLLAYGMYADDPVGGIKSGVQFYDTMRQQAMASSRPSYGSTVFNQSTQGLVFGLHSRRTG